MLRRVSGESPARPARAPGSVSERIAGDLIMVIWQPHHQGPSASHWQPGTSVADDSLPLECAKSSLGCPWVLAASFARRRTAPSGKGYAAFLGSACCQVLFMQQLHPLQVLRQSLLYAPGQHAHPILETFALPHRDLILLEIHILDPQTHALHQPQARAVQQLCHVPFDPLLIRALRPKRIVLEAHHLANLLQQLKLGIGDEPFPGSRRLCFSNIKPPFRDKILWTGHMARFILGP